MSMMNIMFRVWIGFVGMSLGGGQAFAVDRLPCGTPERISEFVEVVPVSLPPRPPSPTKGERDAQGGVCNNVEITDNFVLKWGNDENIDSLAIEKIKAALEISWNKEIIDMEHATPSGTDEYLFNVYIGDTGGCAPSAYGMGGYYTVDSEGWPFIVLSLSVFDDPEYGKTTVAHEFYHAVQHASGAYTSGEDVQWYWEATAMWVEAVVYPVNQYYWSFLYGYAFQPYYQLNSYTYPTAGTIDEYHQYGAFIFPRYLSEFIADWSLIRDSWSDADWDSDPVEKLQQLLPDEDMAVLFGDFAAHNATWDYDDGEEYEEYLDWISTGTQFGMYDDREVDKVGSQGTGEVWQDAPQSTLPERYGYNVIRLSRPEDRSLVVRFDGDAEGSRGSAASYEVRVVYEYSSSVDYDTVVLDGTSGELEVGSVGDERNIYLVVSAFSDAWNPGEAFAYRYQLDMGEVTDSGDGTYSGGPSAMPNGKADTFPGCSCAVGNSRPMSLWGWVLLGFCGWRRRITGS